MPRIAIDEFSDGEAVEVFIAGRLAEAQLIEELFNGCDAEYAVEVQSYLGGTVFGISECRRSILRVRRASGILPPDSARSGIRSGHD